MNIFLLFLISASGDVFSVFLGRVSAANCLCFGISGRRFPLVLVPNWRDEAIWTGGGEGRGGRGFQGGVLARSWNGVFFLPFLSWLSIWKATRMKESKAENSLFRSLGQGSIIATGRSNFG